MKQSLQQTDKTAAVSHRILQLHNTAKAYSDGTQRETFNVSQKEQNAEHFQVIFIAVILRRLNRQLKKGKWFHAPKGHRRGCSSPGLRPLGP